MNTTQKIMGWGLRVLNRFAGSDVIDRLGLRKSSEKALFQATRAGFRTAGAVSRSFNAVQKLVRPARLRSISAQELFDITPTEEQSMLREAAASFAAEQLRPAAAAADQDCTAPDELLSQASDLGIAVMGIPEEAGGAGVERSAMTNVLVAEALSHGDMGLAVACLAPSAVSTALVLWGNEEHQSTYLPAFSGQNAPAAALAILEGHALFDPFVLKTTARRSQAGFEISGTKSLVPLAARAELFIVAAELEGAGPALFIVESKAPGLSIQTESAMGLRAACMGRLLLDRVQLTANALLAQGASYAECVHLARIGWCALATGTAQAALEYLVNYTNERVAFGEPISHRQSVAFSVANIAIETEAMRLMTYRAASRNEQGKSFAREAALARKLCSDKGAMIGSEAVQLLGGHGFVKEHPVERWYRDLRAVGVMEGVVLV